MYLSFQFGAPHPVVQFAPTGLTVHLANSPLADSHTEKWALPGAQAGECGPSFKSIENDTFLCGATSAPVEPATLESTTYALYTEMFKHTPEHRLYRIWHFIPAINAHASDALEQYQLFCKGRSLAFEHTYKDQFQQTLPAASAVGTPGNHLTVVFLAGKHPGTHLENPLQTPAYQYPSAYGPRPPSFARATAVSTPVGNDLFISGTASIRGSDSIGHTIEAQTRTTIKNLQQITSEFQKRYPEIRRKRLKKKVRAYLRYAEDLTSVQDVLHSGYLEPDDQIVYVLADLCRKELNIEIEVTLAPI